MARGVLRRLRQLGAARAGAAAAGAATEAPVGSGPVSRGDSSLLSRQLGACRPSWCCCLLPSPALPRRCGTGRRGCGGHLRARANVVPALCMPVMHLGWAPTQGVRRSAGKRAWPRAGGGRVDRSMYRNSGLRRRRAPPGAFSYRATRKKRVPPVHGPLSGVGIGSPRTTLSPLQPWASWPFRIFIFGFHTSNGPLPARGPRLVGCTHTRCCPRHYAPLYAPPVHCSNVQRPRSHARHPVTTLSTPLPGQRPRATWRARALYRAERGRDEEGGRRTAWWGDQEAHPSQVGSVAVGAGPDRPQPRCSGTWCGPHRLLQVP
jgi:hypothetical protein